MEDSGQIPSCNLDCSVKICNEIAPNIAKNMRCMHARPSFYYFRLQILITSKLAQLKYIKRALSVNSVLLQNFRYYSWLKYNWAPSDKYLLQLCSLRDESTTNGFILSVSWLLKPETIVRCLRKLSPPERPKAKYKRLITVVRTRCQFFDLYYFYHRL